MERKRAWRMREKLFQPTLKSCFAKLIEQENLRVASEISKSVPPQTMNNGQNFPGSPLDEMNGDESCAGSPIDGSTVEDGDSAIGRSSTSPEPGVVGFKVNGAVSALDGRGSSQVDTDFSKRQTWLRTSLRRTARNNTSELPSQFRRYGSMKQSNKRPSLSSGLGSPVYRTSSFNSSGRSSNYDGEDMYSDISIEDDVSDLNQKVQVLERQVTVLAENQNNSDDRYTRTKEENAGLQARLIMLEEQLRDAELRSEEQLNAERRRHKEMVQRLEREKALELENQAIRLQSLEKEVRFSETESERARQQLDASAVERADLDKRLIELQVALEEARQESSRANEMEQLRVKELEEQRHLQTQVVAELSNELEDTRQQASLRLKTETDESGQMRQRQADLEEELRQLRQQNKELVEGNEELQAQLLSSGLEEGRQLLESGPKSLAVELDDMSGEQVGSEEAFGKLRKSLQEQQECNKQLRTYIDGILLSIVENYPQLLEVKRQQ